MIIDNEQFRDTASKIGRGLASVSLFLTGCAQHASAYETVVTDTGEDKIVYGKFDGYEYFEIRQRSHHSYDVSFFRGAIGIHEARAWIRERCIVESEAPTGQGANFTAIVSKSDCVAELRNP